MNQLKDLVVEKFDGSITECQLSMICGGLMPSTGYFTETNTAYTIHDDGIDDNND